MEDTIKIISSVSIPFLIYILRGMRARIEILEKEVKVINGKLSKVENDETG